MAQIIINAKTPTKLDRLGSNRILLKRIETVPRSEEIRLILFPIEIRTKFPSGRVDSYPIHPIQFFSNYGISAKTAATNLVIDKVIEYCRFTTARIYVLDDNDKEIKYKITYEPIKENVLQIYISETFDGFAFGLSPESKNIVKKTFPTEARIANSLSISRETLSDFEKQHGVINRYLLGALTGLGDEHLKFFDYQILNSTNGQVIFTSEQTK